MQRQMGITVNTLDISLPNSRIWIDYNSIVAVQWHRMSSGSYTVRVWTIGKDEPFDFTLERDVVDALLSSLSLPQLKDDE